MTWRNYSEDGSKFSFIHISASFQVSWFQSLLQWNKLDVAINANDASQVVDEIIIIIIMKWLLK